MFGLETGGIDKHPLGIVFGQDACDFVARGLCFFAGDADFLTNQMIDKGGFADIGAADDGDEAAAVRILAHDGLTRVFKVGCIVANLGGDVAFVWGLFGMCVCLQVA